MEVSYTRLVDFIAGEKIFIIPLYQRNYEWKTEHCRQLFKDIEKMVDVKDNDANHFIGTIVYKEQTDSDTFKKYTIIDGQQRITSIILLAKALYDSTEDNSLRTKIYSAFIKNSVDDLDFKLKPSEYDVDAFSQIMNGTLNNSINSRLYDNYKLFKVLIANSNYDVSQLRSAIYRLKIVAMGLSDENPQQIFESLNSTGKDLTETELIRNYLLMDLDYATQERLYKSYWLKMELLLKTSETIENFMFQYLVTKRKTITHMQNGKNFHISKNDMYDTFKKYFKQNYDGDRSQQTEKFLAICTITPNFIAA